MWSVVRPVQCVLRPESEIALHEELSPEQKAKQLGFDDHPVYTYRVAEMLKEPTEKVWGYLGADIVMVAAWQIRQPPCDGD